MGSVTDRQFVALYLWYVEGESQRKIGRALSVSQPTVWELIKRGRQNVFRLLGDSPPISLPIVRVLTEPGPRTSIAGHSGKSASRREELLDALERRMAQRDADEADIRECMAGDSFSPTHTKRNSYDQWETRYLSTHGGEPLPTSAYDARRAAESCACDDMGCALGCERCWHEIRK